MENQQSTHPLSPISTSLELTDHKRYCNQCREMICGPTYFCEHKSREFQLQKSCTELVRRHGRRIFESSGFICNGCRNLSSDCACNCKWCEFNLDVKCASLIKDAETVDKTKIYHFLHEHVLNLCNLNLEFKFICCYCDQIICDSAYICMTCQFAMHQSCAEIPRQVQHRLHPQHLLLPRLHRFSGFCQVCRRHIDGIGLSCEECDFHIHFVCGKSSAPALKHNCHQHNLFYFRQIELFRWSRDSIYCRNCHTKCVESFYHCMECHGMDFHLECIPLPLVVKYKFHSHALTLVDSVVEDDSGEYLCDICENQRNPKHHVYYCDECTYIAHIECVICQDESRFEVLSYLNPRKKLHNGRKPHKRNDTLYKTDPRDEAESEDDETVEQQKVEGQVEQTMVKDRTSFGTPSSLHKDEAEELPPDMIFLATEDKIDETKEESNELEGADADKEQKTDIRGKFF